MSYPSEREEQAKLTEALPLGLLPVAMTPYFDGGFPGRLYPRPLRGFDCEPYGSDILYNVSGKAPVEEAPPQRGSLMR